MRRVGMRAVRAHLVKFALSILAVALGVSFVSGTFTLRAMLSSTFDELVSGTTVADTYVRSTEGESQVVTSQGQGRNRIPIDLVTQIGAVDGVEHALPELTGPVVLVGADGTAVSSGGAPSFGYAFFPEEPSQEIVAGEAPHGLGQIALESTTLKSSGLAIGDDTRIVVAGEVVPVTVVGEVAGFGPVAGATITLFDAATAEAIFAPDALVPAIAAYGDGAASEKDLTERIAATLPAGLEALTGAELREETSAQIEDQLGFVETFLLVFALIALFVGAFIIANTFAMDIRQRQRELALLRAVGASPGQVFTSVLVQAAVVGLIGSTLGVLGGYGLVALLRVVFAQIGMELASSVPLETAGILTALTVGTVVAILSAVLPARRAALTRPVEAMREDTVEVERTLRIRGWVGSALTAVGAAGVLVAAFLASDAASDPAGSAGWVDAHRGGILGAGAGAVVVGVLVLAPLLARGALRVLAAPFVPALPPVGRLARGNVLRNPRRTASTASALVIGMALVAAAAVLAASTQASTRSIVESDFTADFIITTPIQAVPAGVDAAVRDVDGVQAADAVWATRVTLERTGADDAAAGTHGMVDVIGLDPAILGRSVLITAIDGSMATLADGEVAVRDTFAREHGLRVGDELVLSSERGEVTVQVGATQATQTIPEPVLMPLDVFEQIAPPPMTVLTLVAINATPGTDLEALRADLTTVIEPFAVLSLMDAEEFASWLVEQVEQILVILYGLLALSIVIAVLGIVNTLALSIIERTREIGLLRAVGLGRVQLAGTVTIESILTAVFGTLVGVVLGAALASVMPRIFAAEGLTVLSIPAAPLAGMLGLAVVVGVLAALWPATRAARLPVLDAVSYD